MKFFAPALPLLAVLAAIPSTIATPTPDGPIMARDVCGKGYPGYCRRVGSPCEASNGVHEFCSCDRTNIVKCKNGKWTDGKDCQAGNTRCTAREDGAKAICI